MVQLQTLPLKMLDTTKNQKKLPYQGIRILEKMDKRNTAKEKGKRNKAFPYKKVRLPKSVNQRDKYIAYDKFGKELGRYRLKGTAPVVHKKQLDHVTTITE